MKPPKLIGSLSPGAAVGFSQIKALQNTGAPFLTSIGPGYIARTRNGFPEVESITPEAPVTAKPYLWHMYYPTEGYSETKIRITLVDPSKPPALDSKLTTYAPDEKYALPAGLFVGGGFMLCVKSTHDPANLVDPFLYYVWPVLLRGTRLTEEPPGTPNGSWSYSAQFGSGTATALFASGWDGAQWRCGFSRKLPVLRFLEAGDPTPFPASNVPSSRVFWLTEQDTRPRVVYGGTDGTPFAEVILPSEAADRMHYGGAVYVCGEGKLVGLISVGDYVTGTPGVMPQTRSVIPPYIVRSDDHGATWTRQNATFLNPLIAALGALPTSGAIEGANSQLLSDIAIRATFTYIGDGKTLLTFRAGATSYCFLYDGSAFSAVAWPLSTGHLVGGANWTYERPLRGVALGLQTHAVASRVTALPTSYCFGPGCCAVFSTRTADNKPCLTATYNSGATWATPQVIEPFVNFQFVVISPYLSAEQPGRILFTRPNDANTGIDCFQTDGTFAVFKRIGPITQAGAPGTPGNNAEEFVAPTLLVGRRSLRPELPTEFLKA